MTKYTFTFKTANVVVSESFWANDMMEATADLYDMFADAVITRTESQAA